MTLDELEALCEEVGLAHHRPAISALAATAAKLQLQPDDDFSSGMQDSFVGGVPFLPADLEWPVWGERPLAFLAPLQLAHLGAVAAAIGLPSHGSLASSMTAIRMAARGAGEIRTGLAPALPARLRGADRDDVGRHGEPLFLVRDQDPRQRDFSRVWMFLQCS